MIDNAGTHNYWYDTLDRLTAATHPNQANESFTYDDVGNRTASHQGSSYSYQPFNRLVTANGTSFGYDNNGNQISKTDAGGSWSYTWDYENRLKQASLSGGVVVTYGYDALGRRAQRTSSVSGIEKFVYDGADVVRDLDASNATLTDYLNGPGIDNKLRQNISGNPSYFLSDHLGTTRSLADSTGSMTSNLQYDSFGNLVSGSVATRYTFTGREVDLDTGFMYNRARWYEPQQGRFAAEDTIALIGGINLFTYVENNPVLFSDPSGLVTQEPRPYDVKQIISDAIRKRQIDEFNRRAWAQYLECIKKDPATVAAREEFNRTIGKAYIESFAEPITILDVTDLVIKIPHRKIRHGIKIASRANVLSIARAAITGALLAHVPQSEYDRAYDELQARIKPVIEKCKPHLECLSSVGSDKRMKIF